MSKVLVVDDDQGILRLLEHMLGKQGYEVLAASNGIAGLRMAQQELPDLVVLDVMLPGLDGFEVCNRLRNAAGTARTPVLMLSAKGQSADKDAAFKVGADEYLVKPIDRAQFLATVEKLLAQKEAAVEKRARVIAFIGSRGGVGTSTVATSVSVVLAQRGYSTVLTDLFTSFGSVPALMGLKPRRTVAELFKTSLDHLTRDELEQSLVEHSTGVRLLSGEETLEGHGRITPAGVEMLLQELGTLADHIVIDLPPSSSDVVGVALGKCDFINLVAGPGPELLTRTESAIALLSNLGVHRRRLGMVIVDRSGVGLDAELSTSTSVAGIPVTGVIPFDVEKCADAQRHGIPVVLAAPLSSTALALTRLAERLLGLEQLVSSGSASGEGS